MSRKFTVWLLAAIILNHCGLSSAEYNGTQAYNHPQQMHTSVNIATGTFHFSYPLVYATGIHSPFTIKLTYRFNATGMFGLPKGWRLDLDHINKNVVEMGGQWLIDPLWHDETLFASGLKYFNQHGTQFQDNYVEQPIPNEDSQFYRYRSQHKDGVVKYFSHTGLLVVQKDRFGNRLAFEYQKPVTHIEEARLAAITDNYGNRYTFSYEPGLMVVHYPDARQQKIFFSSNGVSTIINPMQQRYELKYINYSGYNLIQTINTPTGLMTHLRYSTIPFKNSQGEGVLPVVSEYKQVDLADNKTHHETQYNYVSGSNYTGYPLYTMSNSADSLMDSNDQNYHYSVVVKQLDTDSSRVNEKIYRYNYLHLPTDIRTLKANQEFLKTEYSYAISPFKYSRSTNYDKPSSILYSVWNEQQARHTPSHRSDHEYDLFGNKTLETHWIYDRSSQHWRQLTAIRSKYYTRYFSLLAETVHEDKVSGKAMKAEYRLSPSKKNHASMLTHAMQSNKVSLWHPWKKESYCHDTLGRVTTSQLEWAAKGMPGIQKTTKKQRYLFDKASGLLTTQFTSSLGNITKQQEDTRNGRILARISALNEKTEFRYNDIGQLTEHIDPEGNVHKIKYYTFDQGALNAKIIESPLGFKKRHKIDASERTTTIEDWVDGNYHVLSEYRYDAFGKVSSSKNKFGQTITYQYDDQQRLTEKTDPWLNKTHYVYDDQNMTTTALVNGKKHIQMKKNPWALTSTETYFPYNNSATMALEISTIKNGFGRPVSKENALLDMQSLAKHAVTKITYEYDSEFNKTKIETRGFDGLTLSKDITYDLFNNVYTFTKKQDDNGNINIHSGYRHIYNTDNQLERTLSPPLDSCGSLVTQHHYDKNGREIKRQFPDGKTVNYQYNPRGLLQSASWNRLNKTFKVSNHYDADGHLTKVCDSDGKEQRYQYDLRGNLTQLTYPDKRQQNYTYDNTGRLIQQKNVGNRVLTYHFDDKDRGKLSAIKSDDHEIRITYGTDDNDQKGRLLAIERNITGSEKTRETFNYDPYGRVARAKVTIEAKSAPDSSKASSAKEFVTREYQFLPRGELRKQTTHSRTADNQPVTDVITYDYDGLHRLIKETHRRQSNVTTSREISYQYDGNNNLIKEHRTDSGQTIYRHYNAADQLISIKKESPNTPDEKLNIHHDKNGRIVVDHQGNKYEYDDKGILLSVSDANNRLLVRFEYLPNGILGHVQSENMSQSFYYHKNNRAQTVIKNQKVHDYLQYGNKFLGTISDHGSDHLFISNQSTSARLGVDSKGNKTSNFYTYEAYGKNNTPFNADNPKAIDENSSTDFLWNQEFRDEATGLVYMRHRFYHPDLKRFIKRDDRNIDNRYAYAIANPISFIDPNGHEALAASILKTGFGVVAILAGIIGGIFAAPTGGGSLSLTAGAGLFGALSGVVGGASILASQIEVAGGNQSTREHALLAGYILEGVAGLFALGALAPTIINFSKTVATSLQNGESIFESISSSMSAVRGGYKRLSAFDTLPPSRKSAGFLLTKVDMNMEEVTSISNQLESPTNFEEAAVNTQPGTTGLTDTLESTSTTGQPTNAGLAENKPIGGELAEDGSPTLDEVKASSYENPINANRSSGLTRRIRGTKSLGELQNTRKFSNSPGGEAFGGAAAFPSERDQNHTTALQQWVY